MGSCAAPSAKGDDKFITTDYLQQCPCLFVFSIASGFSVPSFASDEYPTNGIVYNTKEDASITYSCKKSTSSRLECDFVQTFVRKKGKPEDLAKKIADAKTKMPEALKELSSNGVCYWTSVVVNMLEGRTSPEQAVDSAPKGAVSDKTQFIKWANELTPSKKQDILEASRRLNEFCKTKSEDSFINITRYNHEIELKTCSVGSNQFKQIFKFIQDYSGKGVWVVDASPEGPCGIIQLSRFEPVNVGGGLVFWIYLAQKSVTNPKGEFLFPGLSCSDLDQKEYLYNWKSDRDNKIGCEYIEFSPF